MFGWSYRALNKLCGISVALWLTSAPLALAQGVPDVDAGQFVESHANLLTWLLSYDETKETNEKHDDTILTRADQIADLEKSISLLTGTSGSVAGLETLSGFEAGSVYSIDDNNPQAGRLFGDARETIEMMIADTVTEYAGHPGLAKAGINAVEFRCWFQALIKQESRFSIGICSHAGACGLTQIIPGTADYLGLPWEELRRNPRMQLDGGARYLLEQLNKYGRMELALAAYNAGPGAVDKYNGIPPYAETQNYVVKIRGYYNEYAAQITGADMLGTLSPSDMAIAESSNIADAGIHYSNHSSEILVQSLTRLKEILRRSGATPSVKEAMDLNTAARLELARMSAVLTRLLAAKRKVEWAQYGTLFAAYARDAEFLDLTPEDTQ